MSAPVDRRRTLKIVAALAGLPVLAAGVRAMAPALREFRWQGEAMGAIAEIWLWHSDESRARATLDSVRAEIARYERKFSLFDPESEISRLNRDGRLENASSEFRDLVAQGLRLGRLTGGAFDITVQPLWKLYEARFWTKSQDAADIQAAALTVARDLVDYRGVRIDGSRVSFERAGMGMTLNGIAQGYLTDQVADALRQAGFEAAVIDLGETRAIGQHPDGRPWRLGVKDPARPGQIARTIEVADMALAVSGGYGTTFDETGRYHHIFDPTSGASAAKAVDAAVVSPRAVVADGLATALCVMDLEKAPALLAHFADSRAYVTRRDGTRVLVQPAGLQPIA